MLALTGCIIALLLQLQQTNLAARVSRDLYTGILNLQGRGEESDERGYGD